MPPATPEVLSLTHLLADILPTAGVGGMLALVMFYFVRRDSEQNNARFVEILKRQDSMTETLIAVVKDNTSSNTKLVTVIEGLRQAGR